MLADIDMNQHETRQQRRIFGFVEIRIERLAVAAPVAPNSTRTLLCELAACASAESMSERALEGFG